jgi:Zn-dependent peptidase ImmA (M78 family)
VPGPVTDARAGALLRRYRDRFAGPDLPVPIQSIAEDLLGLMVEEQELDVSGMLFPAERRIVVNASEPGPRRRFTIAHELGHWVCQCLEGTAAPVMCRDQDVSTAADRALEREANVFAAELLMPEEAVRAGSENTFGVSDEAYRWRRFSFGLGEAPR